MNSPLTTTFCLAAWFCFASPLHAAWLDESEVDRMAREISRLKFPVAYDAALALLGTREVQASLAYRTSYSQAAPGKDTPFATQALFTDPAAAKGCFMLVIFGHAKAPTDAAERTVQQLQLRFAMPRGQVLGPLHCDGGYRQLALVPLPPPQPPAKPDKNGFIVGGIVGTTGKKGAASSAAEKPNYRWLDLAAVDRVGREIQTLKFPVPYRTAMALLAPTDGDKALHGGSRSSGFTINIRTGESHMPVARHITLTDDKSPIGYFRLEMSGDGVSPRASKEEEKFDQIAIAYYMPRGPVTRAGQATGGYRRFILLPDTP
ncbi:MAG: hypothetical protein EXS32_06905 [Opitutus sp.]|nr:hypothetical protein [Opitutus sp.]